MTREQMEKMEAFRKQMGHGPRRAGVEAGEPGRNGGDSPAVSADTERKRDSPLVPPDAGGRLLVRQDPGAIVRGGGGKRSGKGKKSPAPRKPLPEAERKKPNKNENQFMTDLIILKNSLAKRGESVRERLGKVNPHAWRDLRLLQSLVNRLQEQLMETMPLSREDYYLALCQHANYHLEITGPLRPEHMVIISDRNLGAVLDVCMENECLMCLRDGKEIEECPIRTALLEVGPPSRIREDGSGLGCEYRDVPGQLVTGKEITV